MRTQTYRYSWPDRFLWVVVTGMMGWTIWFLGTGDTSKETESIWSLLTSYILLLAFCWMTVISFIERIVVDEHDVQFHDMLFRRRRFSWADIKQIRSDILTTSGEGISFRIYNVVSRNHRRRWMIGLWIAHYKNLLRAILVHVPDDAQTDVNVYHAIRQRGQTIRDVCQAIADERQKIRSQVAS